MLRSPQNKRKVLSQEGVMATNRDLRRTALAILRDWSQSKSGSTMDRTDQLTHRIERLAPPPPTATRPRPPPPPADGMYVRKNAGSYISKNDAEQAVNTLKRLTSKGRKLPKDVEPAA